MCTIIAVIADSKLSAIQDAVTVAMTYVAILGPLYLSWRHKTCWNYRQHLHHSPRDDEEERRERVTERGTEERKNRGWEEGMNVEEGEL